jgi:hypothetical protein
VWTIDEIKKKYTALAAADANDRLPSRGTLQP